MSKSFKLSLLIISIFFGVGCNDNSNFRYLSNSGPLDLRDQPSVAGRVIAKIPNWDKIIFLREKTVNVKYKHADGKWTKVKWVDATGSEKQGWIFLTENYKFLNYDKYPLRRAVNRSDISEINKYVDRINNHFVNGITPLYQSIINNDFKTMKHLIQKGADINLRNKNDYTPLYGAVDKNNFKMVKYLVDKGANINANIAGRGTVLRKSISLRNLEIVKYLVDKGANIQFKGNYVVYPLHEAALVGDISIVKYFANKRVDINCKDAAGNTPLHEASLKARVPVIEFLIIKGAKVNSMNENGFTPLHMVAYAPMYSNGLTQSAKILISKGADINARTTKAVNIYGNNGNVTLPAGSTPLRIAELSMTEEVIKVLKKHGAKK